jgi:multidrug efflux system membrane fusion protein
MADSSIPKTMSEERFRSVLEDTTPHSEMPSGTEPRSGRGVWLALLIIVGVAVGAYFLWPRQPATSPSGAPSVGAGKAGRGFGAIPVVAAKARKGDVGVYFNGLGTVTSIYTVSVKSRVDGQLMKILYREGEIVHQGDRLLEIDPRPFEAQLTQFEGLMQRDQALLDNARLDLGRYETLVKQNAAPQQQLATQQALVKEYEGAVKNDEGQIQAAKLNITYCHIDASITGRVGLRLVDPGNIVRASDANGLLVITQVQPISVIFTIAEDQLPTVLQKLRAGQRLEVDAYDREMKNKIAQGWLATVDNQIDQTTGTVRLRATFDNRDNALFPNQFVNARLLVEEKHGVTLVPNAVIQRGSQSTYLYVVKPDSTVTVRQITVGTTEGDDSEVTSGVSPGDVVVMTGVDKLQEGSKVITHFADEKTPRGS